MDENEWRRAHSILCFVVAAWIWGSRSGPHNGPNAVWRICMSSYPV